MEYSVSDKHRDLRQSARRLAEREFSENAFGWEGEYPEENAKILADLGFLGMTLPEEYGGAGMTWFENLMVMEGIGSVCPDMAGVIRDTNVGNFHLIAKHGEKEVKEEYLPPVVKGETWIGLAMSENEAGSAVLSDMKTSAEDSGDTFIINGNKAWVTNAPRADSFVTYVRMPQGHVGSVLIDKENPGLTVEDPDMSMYNEPQSQIRLDDAIVPKKQALATGPDAFKNQITMYNYNRVSNIAVNWISARWLFEEALNYSKEREQGGKSISEYQGIQHRLANMAIKLETGRHLIYRSLGGEDPPSRLLSSMAKLYVSETAHEVADAALQIKGAHGYVGDTPESYAYRKLRGAQISGGTTNIHKNSIAKELLNRGFSDIMPNSKWSH